MSSLGSQNKLKFLFDENVDKELLQLLKSKEFDVLLARKGFKNGKLASISKSEQRILITKDKHFTNSSVFPKESVFSIVWLRIPQSKPESLINSFSELLGELSSPENFEGKLITLFEDNLVSELIPSSIS